MGVWPLKKNNNGLLSSVSDLSVTCTYDNGAAPWTKDCSCSGIFHCNCVMEITECMKAGGCAEICFRKQEVEVLEFVY